MTAQLFLGIDVGTGSARAGLFSRDGRQVGRGERPIRTWQETPDHVEQSSEEIWRAVCAAVGESLANGGVDASAIRGIGFDATCSLVALDEEGEPVSVSLSGDDRRNIIVWMDHRAIDDAAEINAGGHDVLAFVGGTISPEMETPKLRWVKRELPDSWQRAALWFDLPDYLTWRATRSTARSLCTTVCKWTYLGHERRWDTSYFDAIGLGDLAEDLGRIGTDIRVPGELIGHLTEGAAAELGLAAGTAVATSLIDAHAGALGVLSAAAPGVPLTRRMAIIAGTSACHLAVTQGRVAVPGIWGPYFEALIPGSWLLEGGISASGAFLDHVLHSHPAGRGAENVFALAERILARLLLEGASIESLSSDLHLQPNLLGNRSPLADPALKGGVAGWGLNAGEEDLARWYVAALQALACASRHIVEAFADEDCGIDLVIASGTSATNERWCQIHADALGIPVAVPAEPDGVLLGAAMLGAAAAGEFASIESAMQGMTRPGRVYEPDAGRRGFYDRKYAVYRRMIEDQRAYDAIMKGALPLR